MTDTLEKEDAVESTQEALFEKPEPLTQEQADKIERDFFEDGDAVRLRDGKSYIIPPLLLKQAKGLMKKLPELDVDLIAMNLLDGEDNKEQELFDVLMLAFVNYPDMTKERLEEICDLRKAKEIIRILIDLNGLKK